MRIGQIGSESGGEKGKTLQERLEQMNQVSAELEVARYAHDMAQVNAGVAFQELLPYREPFLVELSYSGVDTLDYNAYVIADDKIIDRLPDQFVATEFSSYSGGYAEFRNSPKGHELRILGRIGFKLSPLEEGVVEAVDVSLAKQLGQTGINPAVVIEGDLGPTEVADDEKVDDKPLTTEALEVTDSSNVPRSHVYDGVDSKELYIAPSAQTSVRQLMIDKIKQARQE